MTVQIASWKKHLPNLMTLSRIFVVPFIIWCLMIPSVYGGFIAAAIFILASITDYLDGMLARKYQVVSVVGELMDPVADKILVSSTLIMLIPSERLGPVMVILLLARDTLISGLRSIAAVERKVIAAGTVGKWKTAIQMGAIPAVLIREPILGIPFYELGYWVLWLSVGLSLVSGAQYIVSYLKSQRGLPTDRKI